MKKLLIFPIFLLFFNACDSIKDIPAYKIYLANVPQNSVLKLSTIYPDAKNFVTKEIKANQLWEIKFETGGRNLQSLTDYDGDIIYSDDIFGSSFPLPNSINSYLNDKYTGAAVNSIASIQNADKPIGFVADILNKNESLKIYFDTNGSLLSNEIDQGKLQIQKIISSNNNFYLADNEIPDEIKNDLKKIQVSKFDIKLLVFKSGEKLLEFFEKENQNKMNNRFDYFYDAKNSLIREYKYLNNSLINYSQISDLSSYFQITNEQKEKLQKYEFKYGIQTEKYNVQNTSNLVFIDNQSTKYLVKLASKNSNPFFIISKKIESSSIPVEIKTYFEANNYQILTARAEYSILLEFDLNKAKIETYIIEYEINTNNGKSKKIILFDENFKIKK